MSCVVGVVDRGGVCIGADSAMLTGVVHLSAQGASKLLRVGELAVGITGACPPEQAIRGVVLPDRGEMDALDYVRGVFVPAVRDAFEVEGVQGDGADAFDGAILVACGTRLFTILSTLYVHEDQRPYAAIGGGSEIAFGALYASSGMAAEPRVRLALEAAAEFLPGVRPPFVVEWTGRPLHAVA